MKKYKIKKIKKLERKKKRQARQYKIGLGVLFLIIIIAAGIYLYDSKNTPSGNRIAVIETNMGTMEFELFEDKAPITTKNFIDLANRGFYDGSIFHRVVEGFVIQGGDPTGTGTGGSGTTIPDEISLDLKHDSIGILSMANSGPNTGSSQFFITLAPASHLDGKHSVFGRLIKGEDILLAIGSVEVDDQDKPLNKVIMKVKIIEK